MNAHIRSDVSNSGYISVRSFKTRIIIALIICSICFSVLIARLIYIAIYIDINPVQNIKTVQPNELSFSRRNIVDRNGVLLATNLITNSLYANPHMIIEKGDVASKIAILIPEISHKQILKSLNKATSFVWIKRNLTPKQQYEINALGIPGLYFDRSEKRIYPNGNLTSHILGAVDIDNNGISAIEYGLNSEISDVLVRGNLPVELSLDIRVQNIVRDELNKAVQEFKAIGAVGIVMDVTTGEVISSVSLPDYHPIDFAKAKDTEKFNRASYGIYEMGSVFKVFMLANALELNKISLDTRYDVSKPIKIKRHVISDFHRYDGDLSVTRIFTHSSNIGVAKIARDVGIDNQQEFLIKLGMLNKLNLEIAEKQTPQYPNFDNWQEVHTMTIAFGHGISVSPMHLVQAVATMIGGGRLKQATLRKVGDNVDNESGLRIISESTSALMRKLLRMVVLKGTGKKAKVDGYLVGGKTGSAEKLKHGQYNKDANLASFVGAFPMSNPQYVIFIMLDEPQGNKRTGGYATGGIVAAPVVSKIIQRIAPILGIAPVDEDLNDIVDDLLEHYEADGGMA